MVFTTDRTSRPVLPQVARISEILRCALDDKRSAVKSAFASRKGRQQELLQILKLLWRQLARDLPL
jgi:hypothetical protein